MLLSHTVCSFLRLRLSFTILGLGSPPLSPTGNFEAAMTSYFSSGRFLTSWFVNFSSHSTEDNSSPPSHIALKTSSITSGHHKYLMIFLHRMHQWDIFAHVALLGNSSGNHAACASVSLNNVRVLKVNSRSCARARGRRGDVVRHR